MKLGTQPNASHLLLLFAALQEMRLKDDFTDLQMFPEENFKGALKTLLRNLSNKQEHHVMYLKKIYCQGIFLRGLKLYRDIKSTVLSFHILL